MKKLYGDYSFIPGQLTDEEAYEIIPGTFRAIFGAIVKGIVKAGGKPDLSKVEVIYHTPDDAIGNPLDMNPVEGTSRQIGTTIGVKLKADFEEES